LVTTNQLLCSSPIYYSAV